MCPIPAAAAANEAVVEATYASANEAPATTPPEVGSTGLVPEEAEEEGRGAVVDTPPGDTPPCAAEGGALMEAPPPRDAVARDAGALGLLAPPLSRITVITSRDDRIAVITAPLGVITVITGVIPVITGALPRVASALVFFPEGGLAPISGVGEVSRVTTAVVTAPLGVITVLSHRMYSSISFRKSTPPQNRHLIVYHYKLKLTVLWGS